MSTGSLARHRAARRPVTAQLPQAQVWSAASKRCAAVATIGGLMMSAFPTTLAAAAPAAAPAHSDVQATTLGELITGARNALQAAPAMTISAHAVISVETVSVEAETAVQVTPAPLPPPPPPPAAASRTQNVARSAERVIGAPAPYFANGSAVVEIAMRYVGTPYVRGGASPAGFDCSGLTQYVFAQVGISLPRTSGEQRHAGTVVSRADARPGDIIWTRGHVGIYAGNGMQIDAPRPGRSVALRGIWQSNPTFIRVG